VGDPGEPGRSENQRIRELAAEKDGTHVDLAHVTKDPRREGQFTWISWGSFFLGLIEILFYGFWIAVIFCPLYNYFAPKFK
jgi:hypothetical protein